jgi:hypothetical protein
MRACAHAQQFCRLLDVFLNRFLSFADTSLVNHRQGDEQHTYHFFGLHILPFGIFSTKDPDSGMKDNKQDLSLS